LEDTPFHGFVSVVIPRFSKLERGTTRILMEESQPEEYPVPKTLREFEQLCLKVGIKRAMEISGITPPEEWYGSKPTTPPPAK
jgi:hypothetical protein